MTEQGVGVLPTYGAKRPFWGKNENFVLFLKYHMFLKKKLCPARIWRAFGYISISKSFIDWLLRYEPRFLGWASGPTLPYSGGEADRVWPGAYHTIPPFLFLGRLTATADSRPHRLSATQALRHSGSATQAPCHSGSSLPGRLTHRRQCRNSRQE